MVSVPANNVLPPGGDTGTTVHVAGGNRRDTPHSRYGTVHVLFVPKILASFLPSINVANLKG